MSGGDRVRSPNRPAITPERMPIDQLGFLSGVLPGKSFGDFHRHVSSSIQLDDLSQCQIVPRFGDTQVNDVAHVGWTSSGLDSTSAIFSSAVILKEKVTSPSDHTSVMTKSPQPLLHALSSM